MINRQNTSHAVMSQRHEPKDSLDDFPTPPWGTRALMEHVILPHYPISGPVLEPACNRGYMSRTLQEYFGDVVATDIKDYGRGYPVADFLNDPLPKKNHFEWVITNPPFRLAEKFVHRALEVSSCGVAVLTRTSFLETIGRYERLYSPMPPDMIAGFTERLPIIRGRVRKKATTATSYSWLVWYKFGRPNDIKSSEFVWIPPCRKSLERDTDYEP